MFRQPLADGLLYCLAEITFSSTELFYDGEPQSLLDVVGEYQAYPRQSSSQYA